MVDVARIHSYCIIPAGFLGIVSNLAVLVLICRRKKKMTVFDVTLVSLAIADVGAASLILTYGTRSLLVLEGNNIPIMVYQFSWTGCYFSASSSFFHIIFIGVQRLCAIKFPMRCKEIFTKKRTIVAIGLIWLSAGAVTMPTEFAVLPEEAMSYVFYACGACLVILYTMICYQMKKRQGSVAQISAQAANNGVNKAVVVHSFAVMACFIVCIMPYGTVRLTSPLDSLEFAICDVIFAFNPLLDSLLYFLVGHFRRSKVYLLNHKSERQTAPKESLSTGQITLSQL